MKVFVSAHPIDRAHQERIGIYDSGIIHPLSLFRVLKALILAGHTTINAGFDAKLNQLTIHCSKRER